MHGVLLILLEYWGLPLMWPEVTMHSQEENILLQDPFLVCNSGKMPMASQTSSSQIVSSFFKYLTFCFQKGSNTWDSISKAIFHLKGRY